MFAALEEAGRRGAREATAQDLFVAIVSDDISAAAFILEHARIDRAPLAPTMDVKPRATASAPVLSACALQLLRDATTLAHDLADTHVGTEHILGAFAKNGALRDHGFTYESFLAGRKVWIDRGMPRGRASKSRTLNRLPRPLAKVARLASLGWKVYRHLSVGHPGFVRDPYPLYAKLRERWPVRADPIAPVWVVTRYADVVTVLRDPRFAKDPHLAASLPPTVREQLGLPPTPDAAIPGEPMGMLFIDPPRHTKYRSIFNRGFTPRALALLRPRIERIARERLDRSTGASQLDLMQELAYPLPTIVIAELLGFPAEDYPRLKKWSDDFAAALTVNPTVAQQRASDRSREELREYFDQIVERLKREPGENLISTLLADGVEDGLLTRQELFANCALLMAAGHETTSNLIGNGLLALMRNPDQLKLLRDDPMLTTSALEECLRFESPVQWNSRVAIDDVTLSGVMVPRGAIMLASLGSANRDPDVFESPDRFDIRRRDNKHLAFGQGIHYCIGATLARMEGEIAIGETIRRFPKLRLANKRIRWNPGLIFRGPRELLVRVD